MHRPIVLVVATVCSIVIDDRAIKTVILTAHA